MKCGDGVLRFDVPDDRIGAVIRADRGPASGEPAEPDLSIARDDCAGRDVLVLLPDGTRDQPHRDGYAALGPLLREARSVRVLIATGTHKADTPDDRRIISELDKASKEIGAPLAEIRAHHCHATEWLDLGRTNAGNRVRLNPLVGEADAILVVSDMKPHYFAGYSNAIKFLLPGVAAFECIEFNHAFALDRLAAACRHPLHPDAARRRNPVADDQLDAARLVTERTPVYALATVGGGAPWATFGPLEDAVAAGIRAVDRRLVRSVARRYRYAVVSCGGYPNDETLYIAHRSLELTKEAVADGGEILWLAECRNGIASSERAVRSFFTPLRAGAAAYVGRVRRKYVMFAHKAVKFVELMARVRELRVFSRLGPGTFPIGNMTACDGPVAQVAAWAREGEDILFVDDANTLALTFRGPDGRT